LSVVFQLEQALRELVRPASGDAGVQSLAELGVTFNGTTGQLSFNQTTFASVAAAHPDDVAAFLGSTTGGGFLTTATDTLATLENTDGLLPSQIDSVQKQIDNENQKINDAQTRLIKLNNDLVKQMSAADAAIAALQSQLDFFTALFTETQNVRKNS
jgi:flagellar capping protein FliD